MIVTCLLGCILSSSIPGWGDPVFTGSGPIEAVTQDESGFIWLCIPESLKRFDGHRFVDYPRSKHPTYSIAALKGVVYLGTEAGLAFLDFQKNIIEPQSREKTGPIYQLFPRDGALWLGSGKGLWQKTESGLRSWLGPDGFQLGRIQRLLFDNRGTQWVASSKGIFARGVEEEAFSLVLPAEQMMGTRLLAIDDKYHLWLGTQGGEVRRFQILGSRLGFLRDSTIFSRSTVSASVDHFGHMWMLQKDTSKQDRFYLMTPLATLSLNTSTLIQQPLLIDRDGGVWLVDGPELRLFSPSAEVIRSIQSVFKPLGWPFETQCSTLSKDAQGALLLGTKQGDVYRWDPLTRTLDNLLEKPLPGRPTVTSVLDHQGVWVGTENGLFHIQPGKSAHSISALKGIHVNVLAIDEIGQIWVGTSQGFKTLNPEGDDVRVQDSQPGESVTACEAGPTGVWLGRPSGLYHFKEGQWTHYAEGPINAVQFSQDTLWLGTPNGLAHLQSGSVRPIASIQGNVLSILPVSVGLWVVTDTHLWFYPFDNSQEPFCFEQSKLPGLGALASGGSVTEENEVFLNTDNGMTRFNWELLPSFAKSPPVISEVCAQTNNGPVIFAGHPRQSVSFKEDNRNITFAFSNLQPALSQETQYAVWLKEWDNEWQETTQPEIKYTHLPAGRYEVVLKARYLSGPWSEPSKPFTLHIKAPIVHSRWLGWLACFAVVAGLMIFVLRQRTKASDNPSALHVDTLKDDFLRIVSLEMKTPVEAMMGLTQSIHDHSEELPAKLKAQLATLLSMGRRINALIGNMLDLSYLKNHEAQLDLRPVELHGMVDLLFAHFRKKAERKSINLLNMVPLDTWVLAENERLGQLLMHLLDNALKFTWNGSVTIGSELRDKQIHIWVTDTGPGISKSQQTTVFEYFQKGDAATNQPQNGAGIGLSVAQQLAGLMRGTISVSSEPGKGSTFSVRLEAAREPHGKTIHLSSYKWHPPELTRGSSLFIQDKINPVATVLIVDDETMNLSILSNHLAEQNYHLITATSGEEALALWRSADVLLLDIILPRLSGYEVCRQIREEVNKQELPILMLTDRHGRRPLVRGYQAGANDYLVKPVDKDELIVRLDLQVQLLNANRAILNEKDLLEREVAAEKANKLYQEAEIRMLHAQMNPHFVQNALNNAMYFIDEEPKKTELTLEMLSTLLRQTFKAAPRGWWPLAEEMALIRSYLKLQQIRFGARLMTAIEVEAGCEDASLPCFLIQPLVENAVEHGFDQTMGTLHVGVRISGSGTQLQVEVSNTGFPLTRPMSSFINDEHALGNINKRMSLIFGRELAYRFEDQKHVFTLKIDTKQSEG